LITLTAASRTADGTGAARRTRGKGLVPAVMYGHGDPVHVQVEQRAFEKLLHGRGGEHAIVKLAFEGEPSLDSPALIKAIQYHPVRSHPIHIDFLRIRMDERITSQVGVVLTGQAPGVIEGGMIDQQVREIEIECLALEKPDEIFVDISSLHIGDSIHVRDITAPEGVDILTEGDRSVVTMLAPRVVEEAEEGEEEAEGAEAEAEAEEES
jgi:large subunit ribosomal protein L25